ncbi:hypothetical protein [Myxococcus sp. Y35]|uniref:hypothetical protein n=1 Tax=Pseudomyxococcus flavus TaxID=3115648 RepID=UPI003CF97E13
MAFNIDRFREERVYRCSGPLSELRADLDRLRLLDMAVEKSRREWGQAALLCLGAAVVAVAVRMTAEAGPEHAGLRQLSMGAAVLLLAGTVGTFVRYLRFRRLDLDNRRYTLASQVLHRLRQDIGARAPVKLVLDFTPVDGEEKLLGKRVTRSGWNVEDFSDPWFTLQTRLLDGTHLRIGMVQRLQKRSRTRRSSSGRYKTKHRKRSWAVIQVLLRVKPERHPDLALLEPEARQAVKLPVGVSVARLQLDEDRMFLRTVVEGEWSAGQAVETGSEVDAPRAVVMMLLSLFQVLNYSKHLHKQAKAS